MQLTLVGKIKEGKDVISFLFKPQTPFFWKSGQFLHYTLLHPNTDNRGPERYFTIASAPFENIVMLTTRFTKISGSTFKKALKSLKVGDKIEAVGPDGQFTVDNPAQKMVFIAGGVGITPFRAILLDLKNKNQPLNTTLLYANKTEDFVYKKTLEKIAKLNPKFKIYYFVDPKRIDEKAIKKFVPNLQKSIFYISGPAAMVDSMDHLLKSLNVPNSHIRKDLFPGYS